MRSESSEQSTYENPQSLVENLAPDTSSQINTNFMEQRIVESQRAYPSTQEALSSRVEAEMSDSTWFARHQLMKPVQIAQSSWSVTDARDTDLYTADFPDVLQGVESLVYRTLRMYSFYKLSPCFRVQINATQFHQGQLICSFDPFYQSTRGATEDFCHIYATGLPNVKVMASESDAVELCVPFIHPRSFLTTNNPSIFNNMGRFRITILNPLAVAEGTSPNVTVSVWVYAKDASVHVPIQDHVPILEGSVAEIVATSGQFQNTMSGLFGAVSPIISKIKGGYNQASDVVGNLITGNIGQALRKGQGLIDTLGDLFGFDYPARTINPPKTISPVENLAVGKGVSQSQRLAIDPFSLHILRDDVVAESIDAMNLLKIAQMPMLLTQFAFSNQAADALLFSCPVTPVVCATYQNRLRRTYLSFVSNGFAYWSGGINFDIEVVATRFHSGKLLFAYVPNTEDIPSYADAATSLPNVIVDIQQTSKTTFKIPYTSSTAMKNTLHLDSSAVLDDEFADCAIGTLVCYVQNTLAYASNVSPSIEINIYISGGDDFSLYVPALPIIDKPTSALVAIKDGDKLTAINKMSEKLFKEREIIPTAGIGLNVNKNNADTTMAVLSLSQNDSIPRSHFGEDYSLIDLIRRFSVLNITTLNWAAGATQSFASVPIGIYAVPTIYPSFLNYWSQIYSAWSGTIRYKFILYGVRTSNISIQISHLLNLQYFYAIDDFPGIANISNVNGFGMVRTQLCQDVALELEAPYYSKYNMLLTRGSNAAQFDIDKYSFNGYLAIQGTKTDTTALNLPMDVYTSAGEDFRFLYVRSPPSDTSQNLFTVSTLA